LAYRIGGVTQRLQDALAYPATHRHLIRMGQQAVAHITKRHAWIDDDMLVGQGYQAAEAAHAQGFRTDYLKAHGLAIQGQALLRGEPPYPDEIAGTMVLSF
jgi:hypothetical protein